MSETMSWHIDRNLSIDGQRNTKLDSQFGTTTEIALHKPLVLCPSFLSHTTNPPSSKTTKGRFSGAIKTANQPPN